MDFCTTCPSCSRLPDEVVQFAVQHVAKFLPAGTIEASVGRRSFTAQTASECNEWHFFCPDIFIHESSTTAEIFNSIEHLIQHKFIACTYRVNEADTISLLRIYIIPYDLSGVKGVLRNRPKAVLAAAQRRLRNLLPMISTNLASWQGMYHQSFRPALISQTIVRYNDRRILLYAYMPL